jgi:hypothetical protein
MPQTGKMKEKKRSEQYSANILAFQIPTTCYLLVEAKKLSRTRSYQNKIYTLILCWRQLRITYTIRQKLTLR